MQRKATMASLLGSIAILVGAGCKDEQDARASAEVPLEWIKQGLLSKSPQARQRAFNLCRANWAESRNYFASLIDSKTVSDRLAGAYLFSRLGAKEDLPLLRRCLEDDCQSVRLFAVRGIDRFGDRDSAPQLVSLLDSGLKYAERRAILKILARLDASVVGTYCSSLATHAEWSRRRNAAQTLGLLDDKASADLLLQMIDDPVWMVRIDAAESLSRRKVMASRSRLLSLTAEEMPKLRAAGARCLARLGVREDVALVGRLSFSDDAKVVRISATLALGEFPEEVAFPLVVRVLRKGGEHKKVRFAAIEALGRFPSDAARSLARETLSGDASLRAVALRKGYAAPVNKD